ncbi:hypothetical protein BH23ACT2_BH23ACT2_29120 [soil metagenome]
MPAEPTTIDDHPDLLGGAERAGSGAGRARGWPLTTGLVLLTALPLVLALAAARRGTWYPALDHAMFEQLVRDVGGRDTPLVGAYARVVVDGEQGSHLGPLGLYLLAPVYRVLGASSWALQAATVVVHLLGIAMAVVLARRRAGSQMAVAVTAVVVAVQLALGPVTLVTPWNPYLAVFWWLAFVLAVWSLADGDLPMAPVAVLTGSFCLQNHLEYLALVAALGAVGALGALAMTVRRRGGAARREQERTHRRAPERADGARPWRWVLAALAVIAVAWTPTVLDEVTRDPGNLTLVVRQVSGDDTVHLGLGEGFATLLRNLHPARLTSGEVGTSVAAGSVLPGAALLVVWALVVAVSARVAARSVLRLHAVLAVALAVGGLSMGRYTDEAWAWLGLWSPVLGALVVLASGWSLAPVLGAWWRRRAEPASPGARYRSTPVRRPGSIPVAPVALTLLVLVGVVPLSVQARDIAPHDGRASLVLAEVVPAVAATLEGSARGTADTPSGAEDLRLAVVWDDPVSFNTTGHGLHNELERRGFDVTTDQAPPAKVGARRVAPRGDADLVVALAVGGAIDRWREAPGMREVVAVDLRSPSERTRYQQLEDAVAAELRRRGMEELLGLFEAMLPAALFDERVPEGVAQRVGEMLAIGEPTSVFIGPPEAAP